MRSEELKEKYHSEKGIRWYDNMADYANWLEDMVIDSHTAIREQVVIDALPKMNISKHSDEFNEGYVRGHNDAIDDIAQRLTTREEVERPYVELLKDIKSHGETYGMPVELHERINTLTDGK